MFKGCTMEEEYTPKYQNEVYFLQILEKLDKIIEFLTPAESEG